MKQHIISHQAIIHSRLGEGVVQWRVSSVEHRDAEDATEDKDDSPVVPVVLESLAEVSDSLASADFLGLETSVNLFDCFPRLCSFYCKILSMEYFVFLDYMFSEFFMDFWSWKVFVVRCLLINGWI